MLPRFNMVSKAIKRVAESELLFHNHCLCSFPAARRISATKMDLNTRLINTSSNVIIKRVKFCEVYTPDRSIVEVNSDCKYYSVNYTAPKFQLKKRKKQSFILFGFKNIEEQRTSQESTVHLSSWQ